MGQGLWTFTRPIVLSPFRMLTRTALSAAAAAALLVLAGCGGGGSEQKQAAVTANAAEKPVVPEIPLPQPPLDRASLLAAVSQAASDFATGVDDRQAQKALADKKFEFRLRFGCGHSDRRARLIPAQFAHRIITQTRIMCQVERKPSIWGAGLPRSYLGGC